MGFPQKFKPQLEGSEVICMKSDYGGVDYEEDERDRKRNIKNKFLASKYSGMCYDCSHMWHKRSSSPHICPRCGGNTVDFK